ncbi:MAG: non-ribosomal peptide synthetase, partial [Myxococcales bacterium]|nr:non-ribosomal peptide synthetase [Myxococcales bacterium]
MGADELLRELSRRGVAVWVDDKKLRFRAPAGALTESLRTALKARRDEVIAALGSAAPVDLPVAEPQAPAADAFAPFPLTPIQQAYWIGRGALEAEGLVAAYSYVELALDDLDPARFEAMVQTLVARHAALRLVVDADGQQRVLPQVPPFRLPVIDLHAVDASVRAARCEALRAEMSHQILPADRWPLFDLRAVRLDLGWRLLIGIDLLIADVTSILRLLDEAVRLYTAPEQAPPLPALSYRDYLIAVEGNRASAAWQASMAWWQARLAALPPPPALPFVPRPEGEPVVFRRRQARLDAANWRALSAQARAHGLTPAAALCAAYAEVLADWSRRAPMSLNLTLFNREAIHPDVDRLVGDFTSVLLLAIDPRPMTSFAERAKALQADLWAGLEHARVSGVEVLRALNRGRRREDEVRMPVVFTANLRAEGESLDARLLEGLDRMVYGVSQTPQVWLDHQAVELCGQLVFNWDAVEARFPPGLLDDLFGAYCALLDALAAGPAAWAEPRFATLPAAQAARRRQYNQTAGPMGHGTLFTGFADRAAADAVAVIAPDATLTYGAL